MNEIPTYVLSDNTQSIFSQIEQHINPTDSTFSEAIETYRDTVASTIETAFDTKLTIQVFSEQHIEQKILERVSNEIDLDENIICICLDKDLLSSVEDSDRFKNKFFRFHICRTESGEKIPRQGSSSFEEQFQTLVTNFPDLNNKNIVIVDDGFFSGETVNTFVKLLSSHYEHISIKKIIGFVGKTHSIPELQNIELDIIEPVENIYDWVDIRDFSPLGGKKLKNSKNNTISLSIPYIFPWSFGENANLHMSPHLFTVSENMISAFKKLITAYESEFRTSPIRFKELIKIGFPLPINLQKNISISINDSVISYLDRCIEHIKKEINRPVAIFDMDGTLYHLDGAQSSFQGSSLESAVLKNAIEFIMLNEDCDRNTAEAILNIARTDTIGISSYLSNKYNITRQEYFDIVWNVNPEGLLLYAEKTAVILHEIKNNPDIKLILLTAAPRIWARQVLKYLDIDDVFESVFTGDQYGKKDEIFRILAGRYNTARMISIGDQTSTDILPAENLGMKTFHVKHPYELKQIVFTPTTFFEAMV